MFVRQVVSRQFAQPEQAAILGNRVKPHAPAQFLKENIVGVRQGLGQIHVLAAAHLQHRVSRNYIFL